jgi:hypothetical protein
MTDFVMGLILAFDFVGVLLVVPLCIASSVVLYTDWRWRRRVAAELAFRERQEEADSRRYEMGGLR